MSRKSQDLCSLTFQEFIAQLLFVFSDNQMLCRALLPAAIWLVITFSITVPGQSNYGTQRVQPFVDLIITSSFRRISVIERAWLQLVNQSTQIRCESQTSQTWSCWQLSFKFLLYKSLPYQPAAKSGFVCQKKEKQKKGKDEVLFGFIGMICKSVVGFTNLI